MDIHNDIDVERSAISVKLPAGGDGQLIKAHSIRVKYVRKLTWERVVPKIPLTV